GKLIRGRCPERERRDERSAKVTRWANEPALSQCNVRPCETRYSTTAARSSQCGQILETLKGYTAKLYKLQISALIIISSSMICKMTCQSVCQRSWFLSEQTFGRLSERADRDFRLLLFPTTGTNRLTILTS